MPRSAGNRRDLSKGWKQLHTYWGGAFEERLEYAHRLTERVLNQHECPVVCWSGGKDSTVVLHLVRQYKPEIPVIFVDVGVEFQETSRFVTSLSSTWDINLIIAKPKEGETFWDVCAKYGWPIFGKSIASNVERAVRSGNIRPQMSSLETLLAKHDARISGRCSEFIRVRPSKRVEKCLNADLKFLGIRASESRGRARLWTDYGDHYYVKRYFKRKEGIWKASPISIWTEDDIWKYHEMHDIPHCELYDKGYPRNGCWTCAMGFKHGQLKRLRQGHPLLFKQLITETEMGEELFRLKKTLMKHNGTPPPQIADLERLLELYPDFFDNAE